MFPFPFFAVNIVYDGKKKIRNILQCFLRSVSGTRNDTDTNPWGAVYTGTKAGPFQQSNGLCRSMPKV